MINGRKYDWESVTLTLPWGVAIDINNIEYGDEREISEAYGKGSNPTGYGSGNYKAECKATVLREDFERLLEYAKQKGYALYGIPPFPITVSYANEDKPITTDVLRACKLKKVGTGSGQGDTSTEVELEFAVLNPILWNGVAAN